MDQLVLGFDPDYKIPPLMIIDFASFVDDRSIMRGDGGASTISEEIEQNTVNDKRFHRPHFAFVTYQAFAVVL
jgi:hypothetical protein